MQASQEGPRNLEGEQALGSGLGWGECSTAEQSRGEFGDAASLALSPGASLSVPRVPSHRSGHHQRSPHGSPAALAVLIDESMDDWAEAQATPSRHNHSAEVCLHLSVSARVPKMAAQTSPLACCCPFISRCC